MVYLIWTGTEYLVQGTPPTKGDWHRYQLQPNGSYRRDAGPGCASNLYSEDDWLSFPHSCVITFALGTDTAKVLDLKGEPLAAPTKYVHKPRPKNVVTKYIYEPKVQSQKDNLAEPNYLMLIRTAILIVVGWLMVIVVNCLC